jgi:SPP1 gp7 family putative phage head morphogenesis protein
MMGLNRRQVRLLSRGQRFLDRNPAQQSYVQTRKAERFYSAQLRKIARHVGDIVSGAPPGDLAAAAFLTDRLAKYARLIEPWANAVAQRMIGDVARLDRNSWRSRSVEMGRLLHKEIETAPTGEAMQAILAEQVSLITSLPTEAAQRVHALTIEGITNATRASEIAAEIMRTGEVTKGRAMLIARTEVGRTATTLTMVRAQHIGSTHFEWLTAGDSDVRPSHRALNRKTFLWSDPPECDPGHHALPGCIWNCRCVALPVLDD